MKNNLEDFINNNRDKFDSEEMKVDWEKIRSGLTKKETKIKKMKRFYWAAAASIVLVTSGLVYFNATNNQHIVADNSSTAIDLPPAELINEVNPVYTSQMNQFSILIDYTQNELSQNQKNQPELYKQFLQDNNRLDSSYNYLKAQLSANPNKEVLLDAMIENLQKKLEILNRQLFIINQSKHKKTDNENKTI